MNWFQWVWIIGVIAYFVCLNLTTICIAVEIKARKYKMKKSPLCENILGSIKNTMFAAIPFINLLYATICVFKYEEIKEKAIEKLISRGKIYKEDTQ